MDIVFNGEIIELNGGFFIAMCDYQRVYWQYIRYHPKHQQHQHEKKQA